MIYPLKDVSVVPDGQFGTDPQTYAQFNLAGHNGVDLVADVGTPVYAPEDATVTVSSTGTIDQYTGAPVAGEVIVLRGTNEHWLLHLSRRNVFKGDKVKEGQLIGVSGNTGFTTGPHLHWGVRPLQPNIKNGYRGFIDPMEFMNKGEDMSAMPNEGWLYALYRATFGEKAPSDWVANYMKSGKDIFKITDEVVTYALDHGIAYENFRQTISKSQSSDAELGKQVRELVQKEK